jgi:hypothetical protein
MDSILGGGIVAGWDRNRFGTVGNREGVLAIAFGASGRPGFACLRFRAPERVGLEMLFAAGRRSPALRPCARV